MHQRSVFLALGFAAGLALSWACGPTSAPSEDAGEQIPGDGGDAGASADGGAVTGIPLDTACAAINASRCAFLERCGLLAHGSDAARKCEEYFSATDCGPARWPSRVKQGTLVYDGVSAQACVDAWTTRACADYLGAPAQCAMVTRPAAQLDAVCYGGSRAECSQGACAGATCPRHCKLPATVGGVCEVDADCATDLYCQRTPTGGASGVCAEYGRDAETCDSRRLCAQGYYCGEFGICQLATKIGQPCTTSTCEAAGFCAWNVDGGTCLARQTEGASCADDGQCRSDLLCRTEDGTCAPRGPLPADAGCSRRQTCAEGLACVGTLVDPFQPPRLGTCATPIAEGAACTSTWDCAPPLACVDSGDGGVCSPRQPDGARCTSDLDCQAFSRCHNATCIPLPAKGEPCPSGVCLWGSCSTIDAGAAPVCSGMAPGNQACSRDVECASLRCVSGTCLVACTP